MKRIVLIIVGVMYLVILIGCSDQNNTESESKDKESKTLQDLQIVDQLEEVRVRIDSIENLNLYLIEENAKLLNEIEMIKSSIYTDEAAINIVAHTLYGGNDENLFVILNPKLIKGVYVIQELIDFGSGLYTTMNVYLIKDGKIIESLYDEKLDLNGDFWDIVNQHEL